jgi:hypothetical protein
MIASSLYSLKHILFQLPAGLGTNLFDIEVLAPTSPN